MTFRSASAVTAKEERVLRSANYEGAVEVLDTHKVMHHLSHLDESDVVDFVINDDRKLWFKMKSMASLTGLHYSIIQPQPGSKFESQMTPQEKMQSIKEGSSSAIAHMSQSRRGDESSQVRFRVQRANFKDTPFSSMTFTLGEKSDSPMSNLMQRLERDLLRHGSSAWMGGLADASVVCSQKGTVVHVAVVVDNSGPHNNKDLGHQAPPTTQLEIHTEAGVPALDLQVNYRERSASLGVIPGTSARREIGDSDEEILAAGAIEQAMRPFKAHAGLASPMSVQLTCTVHAIDGLIDPVVLAINAASVALQKAGFSCTTKGGGKEEIGTDSEAPNLTEDGVASFNLFRASARSTWRVLSGREISAEPVVSQQDIAGPSSLRTNSQTSSDDEIRIAATKEGIVSIEMNSTPSSQPLPWRMTRVLVSQLPSGKFVRTSLSRRTLTESKRIGRIQQKSLKKWNERESGSGVEQTPVPGDGAESDPCLPTHPAVHAAINLYSPILDEWLQGTEWTRKKRQDISQRMGPAVVNTIASRLDAVLHGTHQSHDDGVNAEDTLEVPFLPYLEGSFPLDCKDDTKGTVYTRVDTAQVAHDLFRHAVRHNLLTTTSDIEAVEGPAVFKAKLGTPRGVHGSAIIDLESNMASIMAMATLGPLSMGSVQIPCSARSPYKRTFFAQHQPSELISTPSCFWTTASAGTHKGRIIRGKKTRPSTKDLETKAYIESALDPCLPSTFTYPYALRVFLEDYSPPCSPCSVPGGRGLIFPTALALIDAGVPLTSVPCDMRIGIVLCHSNHKSDARRGEALILEPTPLEESVCDAILSVAYCSKGITTLRLRSVTGQPVNGSAIENALTYARRSSTRILKETRLAMIQSCQENGRQVPEWLQREIKVISGNGNDHDDAEHDISDGAGDDGENEGVRYASDLLVESTTGNREEIATTKHLQFDESKGVDGPHEEIVGFAEMAEIVRAKRLAGKCIGVTSLALERHGSNGGGQLPCAALVPFARDLAGRLRGFAASNEWSIEATYGVQLSVFDDPGGPLSIANSYDAWGRRSPATTFAKAQGSSNQQMNSPTGSNDEVYAYLFSQPDAQKSKLFCNRWRDYASKNELQTGGDDWGSPSNDVLALGARERLERALEAIEPIILDVQVGDEYLAEVVKVLDHGAILRLNSANEALLHSRDMGVLENAWHSSKCHDGDCEGSRREPAITDLLHPGQRIFVDVTASGKEHIQVRVVAPEGRADLVSVDAASVEAQEIPPIPPPINQQQGGADHSHELRSRLLSPDALGGTSHGS